MIQRVLTLLLILSVSLFSRQYDETLLNIEAKLFPKIAVLEENIKNKDSSKLEIGIVYESIDEQVARSFKSKILKNYSNKLVGKRLEVSLISSKEDLDRNLDFVIFMYIEESRLVHLVSWANRHNILTFSYDPSDLYYGIACSIYIGKSTKPYLHAKVIKKFNFTFDPYLLRLSKIKN